MALMLNSTLVPALALLTSLEEFASIVERVTDFEYLSRSTDEDGDSIGAHVASCVGQLSAVLAGSVHRGPDRSSQTVGIERSRQDGVSALRALIRDLDAVATFAIGDPLRLDPQRDAEGRHLQRTAAAGRDLAMLLPQVRHHKAQVLRRTAAAVCVS
jgi:hypothetical protein